MGFKKGMKLRAKGFKTEREANDFWEETKRNFFGLPIPKHVIFSRLMLDENGNAAGTEWVVAW